MSKNNRIFEDKKAFKPYSAYILGRGLNKMAKKVKEPEAKLSSDWDGYIIPQRINGEHTNKLSYITVLCSRKVPLLSLKLLKRVLPLVYHVSLSLKPMLL